jgi:hypothetical protein
MNEPYPPSGEAPHSSDEPRAPAIGEDKLPPEASADPAFLLKEPAGKYDVASSG